MKLAKIILALVFIAFIASANDEWEKVWGTKSATLDANGNLDLGTGTIQGGVFNESFGAGGIDEANGRWVRVSVAATRTLPPVSPSGQNICYHATTANVLTIDTDGTDTITLDADELAPGFSIDSSGVAGEFICLLSDGSTWFTLGQRGAWEDGGAS